MPVKKGTVARFKLFRSVAKPEFRSAVDTVIQMYENRNIGKEKEAEHLLRRLVGPKPQTAVALLSKYSSKPTEAGKLSRPTAKTINKGTKKYFINGVIRTQQKWIETRRGQVKETSMTSKVEHPFAQTIEAKSPEEARGIYRKLAEQDFNQEGYHLVEQVVDAGITIDKVVDITQLKATPTQNIKMKSASPVTYDYIPADTSLDSGKGFCVLDNFVTFYGQFIKKLTKDYFVELCNEFYGVSALDEGIDLEEGEDVKGIWTLQSGVCPQCLTWICEKLNISTYAFDVTRKCFIKNVALKKLPSSGLLLRQQTHVLGHQNRRGPQTCEVSSGN